MQVNFYFTDEELERARKASEHTTCRVHGEERLCFYCKPCERVICIKCKLTKHEGHVSEDLTETAEHCKEEIQRSWALMEDSVKIVTKKLHEVQKNNEAARQKCLAVKLQVLGQTFFSSRFGYRYICPDLLFDLSSKGWFV